jgi:hypothetical protein
VGRRPRGIEHQAGARPVAGDESGPGTVPSDAPRVQRRQRDLRQHRGEAEQRPDASPPVSTASTHDARRRATIRAHSGAVKDEPSIAAKLREGRNVFDSRYVLHLRRPRAADAACTDGDVLAAADAVASAGLDATPLLIRVRRWEYDRPTMRTDRIIAAIDVSLVDAGTGRVVWEKHRAAAPVQLHGELLSGQADVVAAEEVMREMLSGIGVRSRAR